MDSIVPDLYRAYGKYVNNFRAFPLDVDGLKPVERRVLLSSYEIARDKFVKCARIDGHCIGHYHPHGSAYSTIVQLVKQTFLEGQGNFGSDVGVDPSPPAAMRYTECRLSKFAKDIAFKLINYIPWVEGELDKEPAYLPSMFPFCVLGREYTQGIGFGFKTVIPCYEIKDLYNRLLFLVGKKENKVTIRPISDCVIISEDKDLEMLLTTGKATLLVRGKAFASQKEQTVVIRSWPPGRKFEYLLSKFEEEMDGNDIGYQDLSTSETHIIFSVLKQRNRDQIFKKFVKKMGKALEGNIPFEVVVVSQDAKVKTMSVDQLLLTSFTNYLQSNSKMLSSEIVRCQEAISEYQALIKIRPYLRDHLQETTTSKDLVIEDVSNKSGVSKEVVSHLFSKYRIIKLLSVNVDVDELDQELQRFIKNLDDLKKFTLDQYEEIIR